MIAVLIVEDESAIANLICTTLKDEGYSCDCAYDGEQGADLIDARHYDLVLLDLMMPQVSGYELLDYIRPLNIPVIIISAMGQVNDRIKGLRHGADDYLVKPFQIGELLARVESVLRRAGKIKRVLTAKHVALDLDSHMVYAHGQAVELTNKEFDLLAELLRHKNVALSREYLYETVWEESYTGETRTLDSHIQRLRKKLDLSAVIKTVFRIGYRLEVRE